MTISMPSRTAPVAVRRAESGQVFGTLVPRAIGLAEDARGDGVASLNQLLADTLALRDLYKKHHWQASGATFYPLHLLFDKHAGEQTELADRIAERVMTLGGVCVAVAADVAELTAVPRPPKSRESTPAQLARLLHGHEVVLTAARSAARQAARDGDDGTNDLLVGGVIRTNETQVWFVAEHLGDGPAERADGHQ